MRNQNSNSTPAVAYETVPDGFGNYWYSAKGYQANYGSTFSSSVKTFEFTLTTTSPNETLSVNSISYDFATAFNNSSLGVSSYVDVGFWYYNESSSSYTKIGYMTLQTGGITSGFTYLGNFTYDLSNVAALQDVQSARIAMTFICTDGHNSKELCISNLTVNGSLSIPEPGVVSLGVLGFGFLADRRRK